MEDEKSRLEAVLAVCCLLPPNQLATLIYLTKFFNEVAEFSDRNKMYLSNLAIVLTPTFFPMEENANLSVTGGGTNFKKLSASSSDDLESKTAIVEAIFRHCDKVSKLTKPFIT